MRRITGSAAVLALVLLAAACGGSAGTTTKSSSPPSSAIGSSAPAAAGPSASDLPATFPPDPSASAAQSYVSIGDSYAAGYQPTAPQKGSTTRNGFAYQVVTDAKAKGYDYSLVNFGCSGATTASILNKPGCPEKFLGPGAPSYSQTQAAAAEAYLKSHRGKIGLVTVSIGGNDITYCGGVANPTACLAGALGTVETNLKTLVTGLRAAAGPNVRIVGITYPDVLLGNSLSTDATKKQTATLSVFAFRTLINPALKAAYASVGARFVDVTAATGAYGSLDEKTTLPPYGSIPVPVAKICTLTYFCEFQDIHPRTKGYGIIADLVVGTLPKR
ncbi:MAG: GDSL-type esterase/lipase family protein [Jatrophihabitans sp.]